MFLQKQFWKVDLKAPNPLYSLIFLISFSSHSYVICMSFVCQSYVLICNSYVIRMLLVCACMSFVCNSCVRKSSVYTRMPLVCLSYVLVCHPYVTCMYSYVIRMSRIYSYVTRTSLECNPYVTRMYSYVTRMSLVCTRMSSVCHSCVVLPWILFKSNHEGVETAVENSRDSAVSILNYS